MTNQAWKTLDNTFKEEYTYDDHGRLTKKKTILPNNMEASIQVNYGDALGRVSSVQTPVGTIYYNYLAGSGTNTTTPLVSAMSHNAVNGNSLEPVYFTYAYDQLGNITSSTERYGTIERPKSYTYDAQSQLTKETHFDSNTHYTYDTYGNIRTKKYVPYYDDTVLYEYGYSNTQWRDLLTSISITRNNATNPEATGYYTYDEIGNPKQYYNVHNNTTWTLGWFANRSLRQAKTGSTTINYEYDVDGLRTKKNVNGVVHNYIYASGKLLRESYTQNSTSYVLDFVYDRSGRPFMLYLKKGTDAPKIFYYLLNQQGDVVRLVTATGVTAAEYRYDAWGKATEAYTTSSSTVQNLAAINPLRYRGYYYDTETGWYYLQSRYYDPGLGRFINADCTTNTGQGFIGHNMFAYCLNNPVILFDVKGEDACIVINSSGAGGFGHVGLFVQDEKGIWYYHSFVAAVSRPKAIAFGILGYSVNGRIEDIELSDGYGYNLESFSGFKDFAIDSKKMEETAASMDTLIYLKGDYTQTRAVCKSLVDHQISEEGSINPIQYNLRRYNCMHFVSKVLSASPSLTREQRFILSRLMKKTVPNWNDETIKKMGCVLK